MAELSGRIRKHLILGCVTAISAAATVALFSYSPFEKKKSAAPVAVDAGSSKPLRRFTGHIEPVGESEIVTLASSGTDAGGRAYSLGLEPGIESLNVSLGDRVMKGQVIAVLRGRRQTKEDISTLLKQIDLDKKKISQWKSSLSKVRVDAGESSQPVNAELQSRIERQTSELARISGELDEYKALFEEGAIARSKVELKEAEVKSLTESLAKSKELLSSSGTNAETGAETGAGASSSTNSGTDAGANVNTADSIKSSTDADTSSISASPVDEASIESEIATLKREISDCQYKLRSLQSKLDGFAVRSPRDGVIVRILSRPGERSDPRGIVEIAPTGQMSVVLDSDADSASLPLGKTASAVSINTRIEMIGTVSTPPETQGRSARAVLLLDPQSSRLARSIADEPVEVIVQ